MKNGKARNRLLFCEEVSMRQTKILADTEFSKGQNIPVAFTVVEEIDKFMKSCIESKEKKRKSILRGSFPSHDQYKKERNRYSVPS